MHWKSLAVWALIAPTCAARADTISIVTPFAFGFAEAGFTLQAPGFDASLGAVTGISFTIDADMQVTIAYQPVHPFFPPDYVAGFVGDYILSFGAGGGFVPLPEIYGRGGETGASASFTIDDTIDVTSPNYLQFADLPQYGYLNAGFRLDYPHGLGGGFEFDYEDIAAYGALTETFDYTPVPEPGSLAVFTAACVVCVAALRFRQNIAAVRRDAHFAWSTPTDLASWCAK